MRLNLGVKCHRMLELDVIFYCVFLFIHMEGLKMDLNITKIELNPSLPRLCFVQLVYLQCATHMTLIYLHFSSTCSCPCDVICCVWYCESCVRDLLAASMCIPIAVGSFIQDHWSLFALVKLVNICPIGMKSVTLAVFLYHWNSRSVIMFILQWNLYNETGKVLSFTKSCFFSQCHERPPVLRDHKI